MSKLLDIVDELEAFRQIYKREWLDRYLVRKIDPKGCLVLCDLDGMTLRYWEPTMDDLTANDWDIMK